MCPYNESLRLGQVLGGKERKESMKKLSWMESQKEPRLAKEQETGHEASESGNGWASYLTSLSQSRILLKKHLPSWASQPLEALAEGKADLSCVSNPNKLLLLVIFCFVSA